MPGANPVTDLLTTRLVGVGTLPFGPSGVKIALSRYNFAPCERKITLALSEGARTTYGRGGD